MAYTPWLGTSRRCACGALLAGVAPLQGSFRKLRRRLREEAPTIWIESTNVRLLMVDGAAHGELPMLVHRIERADEVGTIAFLGPWTGDPYQVESLIEWSFAPANIPAPLRALAERLGVDPVPVVIPSGSTLSGIHATPGSRIMAIAADHAGRELKERLVADFAQLAPGWELIDIGGGDEGDDYPDIASTLSRAICEGRAERGVLVCGSGIGVTIAANKHPGIRASIAPNPQSAAQGVEHDALNVLALGARTMNETTIRESLRAFATATPSTEERHRRRLDKVAAIEARYRAPRR